ncbi:peptidylprolyl isomerase [Geobacter anodireducens]|uniref:Peptidylprolyl isomerase n=1 Tax=Geobacter anodireducens TaxID=1340425 RepID=A0ABR9NW22_9BACT|nr:peptidylprolyl isomerase [Geobacter anodireducens]MBE2888469.1 peptidylprolyl isomerase [Geobacter anodireducens]
MSMNRKKCAINILMLLLLLGGQAVVAAGEGAEIAGSESAPAKMDEVATTSWGDVLARVNDTAITRADVDRAVRIFLAQNRVSHDLAAEVRKQADEAALEQVVATRLLYLDGLKLEIKDLDKQINDRISRGKAKFPAVEEYVAALKANNLSEQDALEIVRTEIVVANLLESRVISRIVVTDAEIRAFYDQNQDKFKRPEGVRLSHILIGVSPQALPEEKQKAREKAESLRNKLLAGEDFAALAKSESSCPSKEQGGDLGVFTKKEMVPEFEKGTASLGIGEISPVVETQEGYHILKLTEIKNSEVISVGEAKERVGEFLKQNKAQQAINDYVAGLKQKAKIEYLAVK